MRVLTVVARLSSTHNARLMDPTPAQGFAQHGGLVVVPNQTQENRLSSKRGQVGGRVGGTSRHMTSAEHLDDGTGASGEIRRTSPQIYSSSITSPRTRTRFPRKPAASARLQSSFMVSQGFEQEDRPRPPTNPRDKVRLQPIFERVIRKVGPCAGQPPALLARHLFYRLS